MTSRAAGSSTVGRVCYASLPVPFTCDAVGMTDSVALLTGGGTTLSFSSVTTCPTNVTSGTTFTTVLGTGVSRSVAGNHTVGAPVMANLVDGTGSTAQFAFMNGYNFTGARLVGTGSVLYVADTGNSAIRKVDPATGVVTTVASGGYLVSPQGIAAVGGYLYVADNNRSQINKVEIATGAVTALAGGNGVWGTADGVGSAARFHAPTTLVTDGSVLYVSDAANKSIRKVDLATAAVTTLSASVGTPAGLVLIGTKLYVASRNDNCVRVVDLTSGAVTVLAGSPGNVGTRDGLGSAALFGTLDGLATDGTSLYVADGQTRIRKIDIATGLVKTWAGSTSGSADGTGDAALFSNLGGLTWFGGKLYATDSWGLVREVH